MDERPAHRADRLRRAWALVKGGKVKPLGGTRFLVAGNVEEVYEVDLAQDPSCHCRDMENRSALIKGNCKHVLGARIASCKDEALLDTIAEWMDVEVKQQAATARTTTRTAHSTEG